MADQTASAFKLRLLGVPCVVEPGGQVLAGRAAQRHRLALLALLALAPDPGIHRDKVMAYLWPERDAGGARHLLKQAIYVLRAELGADVITASSDRIRLNTDRVGVDARDFDAASARGDHPSALALYGGPFLDGFFLGDAPEFERWMEGERERLARSYRRTLEALAVSAEAARDYRRAVETWRALAAHDPLDSRVAVRMAEALAADGNRVGALEFAMAHARLVREEYGVEPPTELAALVERLRLGRAAGPREAESAASGPSRGVAAGGAHTLSTQLLRGAPSVLAGARSGARGEVSASPAASAGRGGLRRFAATVAVAFVVGAVAIAVVRFRRGLPDEAARQMAHERGAGSAVGETRGRAEPAHYVAAQELYLRGSDPALLRNDSGVEKRLQYFLEAVALDSTYGLAYSGLAATYVRLAMSDRSGFSAKELQARAEVAAARGVALADSVGETHAVLGLIRMRAHDFAAAEDEFRQAIALDPSDASMHESLAGFYLVTGRPREGLAEAQRALELDPLSSAAIADFAHALLFNGRCDEALAQLRRIASVRPPLLRAAPIAAQCYAAQRRWVTAVAVLQPQRDRDPVSLALSGYLLARAGQREQALEVEAALLERWRKRHEGAEHIAEVYAGLGDLDMAFAWLDRALDDGSLVLNPWWGEVVEPGFQPLQRDRRFRRVRQRLDLPGD
jgi:DNA-binding SARP family transcriptional activator